MWGCSVRCVPGEKETILWGGVRGRSGGKEKCQSRQGVILIKNLRVKGEIGRKKKTNVEMEGKNISMGSDGGGSRDAQSGTQKGKTLEKPSWPPRGEVEIRRRTRIYPRGKKESYNNSTYN